MNEYVLLNDTRLQSLAASGCRDAEDELVSRYMRLVRACARPFFLAGGDSEDLIQEAMFGLISAIRTFDAAHNASFSTYAEHCIKMRILSAVKSASRIKHFPLNDGLSLEQLSEESNTELSAFPQIDRRSPEDQVLARESKEELYSAFEQCLSRMERQVLAMYLDGLSYSDIADRLRKDSKAVDNAVQRIRRKLARNPNLGDISQGLIANISR